MSRTLLILRHGKAQPGGPEGDKARALTELGRHDSKRMGRLLAVFAEELDLIVTSDALRADETARLVAGAASYAGEIITEPRIYEASLDDLLAIVRGLPESATCVLLVGHNPGLEELCDALSDQTAPPARLPTAALVHLRMDATSWRNVREGTGKLLGLYMPHEL